ncbi:phosphodiester glycosidase family protein [Hymenobacter saemangeumensis]|uniref:Phosphodiester glycosidase family protein n=1 Tax=Hymenobacter saemangeumensis TaxID=1084522 RepID=A0ABP8I989_9BACT
MLRLYSLLAACFCAAASPAAPEVTWQQLSPGLALGEYRPTVKSDIGDSKITILRINPRQYSFRLLESVRYKGKARTAAQWCQQEKLLACINAGMYQPDGRSVGYMRDHQSINNASLGNDNSILVFNPADSLRPAIKLIDRSCETDWAQQLRAYHSASQSIRMVDCQGRNTWAAQPKRWSSAVWAMDQDGNALMIFCRSPYSMHDYVDILLQSPLKISQAMYLEGGPEASLSIRSGQTVRNLFGSYETGFVENDNSQAAFPLPNVIGIVKK